MNTNKDNNKFHIMDMDGTILDSMHVWINIDDTYLISKGVVPPDNIARIVEKKTMMECCVYFQELGVKMTPEEIYEDIMSKIFDEYRLHIQIKDNMKKRIEEIIRRGEKICLFTSSERRCAVAAFERLGIIDCFDSIYTCAELGMKKTTPDAFLYICKENGFLPEDTYIYEDALYAVKSAKATGCHVIAVAEPSSANDWEEIKSLADEIII